MSNPNLPTDRELVLDRYIDAPREQVWRCWTDAEQLVKWSRPHHGKPKAPLSMSAQADRRWS